jgi:hypothetical protein
MDLLFNKMTKCPDCGCEVVVEESVQTDASWNGSTAATKIREHCEGGRWEKRAFLCGFTGEYVPNFRRVEPLRPCRNTPKFNERLKRLTALRRQKDDLEAQIRRIEAEPNPIVRAAPSTTDPRGAK